VIQNKFALSIFNFNMKNAPAVLLGKDQDQVHEQIRVTEVIAKPHRWRVKRNRQALDHCSQILIGCGQRKRGRQTRDTCEAEGG